jgi:transposase
MGSAIGLRDDFDGAALRRLARLSKSANQARRLLAPAQIYDGSSRSEAAKIGGVTLQIVRNWVLRFNARGPDGLLDGKAPGKRSILTDTQRRALVDIVEQGPIPAIHGVVRWRLIDLVQWLHDEFAVSLDETTVGRELRKLGYVKPNLNSAFRDYVHYQCTTRARAFLSTAFRCFHGVCSDERDQAAFSRMLAGSGTPAAWNTCPACPDVGVRTVIILPSFSIVACWRRSRSLRSGCHSGWKPLSWHSRVNSLASVRARNETNTWPRIAASD